MKYRWTISVDQIIEIHDVLIEKYGGVTGILNRGELEFIVDQVNHERKSIFWKAAIILRGITCGHPFVDGNKRTALEVADIFLRLNNYKITATDSEKFNFVMELASQGMELKEIISWLEMHVEKSLNRLEVISRIWYFLKKLKKLLKKA